VASFLTRTLQRSRARLKDAVERLIPGRVGEDDLEALEEALIAADVGPETADYLVDAVRQSKARDESPRETLVRLMIDLLERVQPGEDPRRAEGPEIWLLVGVNGSGKTTTTAKLAHELGRSGRRVVLGAADTFRAAAVEQLKVWGERIGVPVIAHRTGGDPAAVVFDTCEAARARRLDVALIDTAGRLHTKGNLMAEIDKVRRVAGKVVPDAPHQVLLVLDGTTGQNGLRQAEQFLQHAGVTGLVLAKLDGTARGGVALTIARQLGLPIRYIGTGEALEDLERFDARAYVEALIGDEA
jgi:fused signal recognition particle receptor